MNFTRIITSVVATLVITGTAQATPYVQTRPDGAITITKGHSYPFFGCGKNGVENYAFIQATGSYTYTDLGVLTNTSQQDIRVEGWCESPKQQVVTPLVADKPKARIKGRPAMQITLTPGKHIRFNDCNSEIYYRTPHVSAKGKVEYRRAHGKGYGNIFNVDERDVRISVYCRALPTDDGGHWE
jgi:hypothetical protein